MSQRPPELTAALVAYLGDRLTGVHVGTQVPNPAPEKFIRIGVGDGSRSTLVTVDPVVLFECWAPDSVSAEALVGDAWQAINDADGQFIGDVWVQIAQPRIPYGFPDPTYDTRNRWQFYCQMTVTLKETTA